MEVLKNDAMRMQWLHMPEAQYLTWMTKQVDKMHCFVELINTSMCFVCFKGFLHVVMA